MYFDHMKEEKKLSLTFRLFRKLGVIANAEKYGNISIFGIIGHAFVMVYKCMAFKYCYSSMLLGSLNLKKIRAKLWRSIGCKVGKHVLIGHSVSLDYGNAELITIEDKAVITNCCILLCHRRDVSDYCKYDDSYELPYIYKPIHLKKGCQIGMGSIIMPGVTIGEGSIIGARSVVTRDIPDWVVAAGSPCKVIKDIPERLHNDKQ